jgi:hypothetical protein
VAFIMGQNLNLPGLSFLIPAFNHDISFVASHSSAATILLRNVQKVQVSDTTGDEERKESWLNNYTLIWEEFLKLEKPPCLPGGIEWQNNLPVLEKK